jgi:cysteine desulfurase/selenocysteine lyase
MFGGSMVQRIDTKSWDSMPMPTMWEAGTSPVAEIIAFGRTLTFLETISMSLLKKHEASLTRQFVSEVAPFEHITLVGNPVTLSEEGHLVSFLVKDWHAHDVALYLAQHGIAVRSGYHCAQPLHIALNLSQTVRASWYMYTTSEDIARLIGALKNLGA